MEGGSAQGLLPANSGPQPHPPGCHPCGGVDPDCETRGGGDAAGEAGGALQPLVSR